MKERSDIERKTKNRQNQLEPRCPSTDPRVSSMMVLLHQLLHDSSHDWKLQTKTGQKQVVTYLGETHPFPQKKRANASLPSALPLSALSLIL